jgi:exodeoxyribonuclease-3
MRIITINVNGIRAAERKGFFNWLKKQNADVVCLQEIKAQEDQLDERFYPRRNVHVLSSCRAKRI